MWFAVNVMKNTLVKRLIRVIIKWILKPGVQVFKVSYRKKICLMYSLLKVQN